MKRKLCGRTIAAIAAAALAVSSSAIVFADDTVTTPAETSVTVPAETSAAETTVSETVSAEPTTVTQTVSGGGYADNDEMFALYINRLMYGDTGVMPLASDYAEGQLTGNVKIVYNELKELAVSVANGTTASTKVTISFPNVPASSVSTNDALGAWLDTLNVGQVINVLMENCPSELYWYNKSEGAGTSILASTTVSGSTATVEVTISMSVADAYAASGEDYKVDTAKINAAKTAVETAKGVAQNAAGTTLEKLTAFKDHICGAVTYNDAAADDSTNTPYGDPWQLIYVFDGNSGTNVVCEGYAKAFQYLCEIAGIECYTVSGTMSGGTGEGAHMWNLVRLGGKSYLVDVTNCDDGTAGAPDLLFLKGVTLGSNGSYSVDCDGQTITYTYDSETTGMFSTAVLTPSTTDYTESGEPEDEVPVIAFAEEWEDWMEEEGIEIGINDDPVDFSELVTVTPESAEVSYSIEDTGIAEISASGLITPVSKGETVITVTAVNGDRTTEKTCTLIVGDGDVGVDPTETSPTTPDDPTTEPTTPTEPTAPTEPTTPSESTAPTEPTVPTNPTVPSEPSGPSAPSVPSGPMSPTIVPSNAANASVSKLPAVSGEGGEKGWTAIAERLGGISDGESVSVDMNGDTTLPKDVLETIIDKDVDVTFKMAGGISWTINGKSVEEARDVDLGVSKGGNKIPRDVLKTVSKLGSNTIKLSLKHNGDFGFKPMMTIKYSARYNGKYANLYYYNKKTGEMEFQGYSKIEGGSAKLLFNHASEYAVVVSDEPLGGEDVSAAASYEMESSAQNGMMIVLLAAAALIGSCVLAAAKSKKRDR